MLKLNLTRKGHDNATIEVIDDAGKVRCDVHVEVYKNDVKVHVTDDIVERNSDEVSWSRRLMEAAKKEEKEAHPPDVEPEFLKKLMALYNADGPGDVDRELCGWNDHTKLVLAERFITEMRLETLYEQYLDGVAAEELGQPEKEDE